MQTDSGASRKLQQDNTRLEKENHQYRAQIYRLQHSLQALIDLQRCLLSIQKDTNLFQLINQVLKYSMEAVGSENGSLALLDERTGDLVFVEVLGESRTKLLNYKLPLGKGLAHWCIKNKRTRLITDTVKEPVFSPTVEKFPVVGTLSLICIPLFVGQRALGVIEVLNTSSKRIFNEADREIMILVGHLAGLIIAEAEKL